MKKLFSILIFLVLFLPIFVSCGNDPSNDPSNEPCYDSSDDSTSKKHLKSSKNLVSGLKKSTSITAKVNGIDCKILLDSATGYFKIEKMTTSRAAEDEEIIEVTDEEAEGIFFYTNGVLSLEINEDDEDIFKDKKEDDNLYMSLDISESENKDYDIKISKQIDEENNHMTDAYVDYSTSKEINTYVINKPQLPANVGTNPFKINYEYVGDSPLPYKDYYIFTEDKVKYVAEMDPSYPIEKEYYYSVDTDNKVIYMLSTTFDSDYEELVSKADDYIYENYIEGKTEAEIEKDFKYYRGFYGLSEETSSQEVLNTMYRHQVHKFKAEHLIDAYSYILEGDALVFKCYLSNKTTFKDFFENGTGNMTFQADKGIYHYPISPTAFQPVNMEKYRANMVYQIIDVLENSDGLGGLFAITKEWWSEDENFYNVDEPHIVYLEYKEIEYDSETGKGTLFIKAPLDEPDVDIQPLKEGLNFISINEEVNFYTAGTEEFR